MTGPKFCNRKDYSTYEKVQDIYPDAPVIKEVPAGFLVFVSLEEFRTWQEVRQKSPKRSINQRGDKATMKKQRNILHVEMIQTPIPGVQTGTEFTTEALTPEVIKLLMDAWEFFEDERLDDFKNNPECWEQEDKGAFEEEIKKVNKAWPILEELRGSLERPEEPTEELTYAGN